VSSSFDDLIARAKAAPRPHRDVDVNLDGSVSDRIAELEAERELTTVDQRLSDPRPAEIAAKIAALQAESADALVTLRFTQLPGQDWSELTARSPMRVDVAIDRTYGYNYHEVCKAAAVKAGGRVIDDGVVEPLTETQWAGLWPVLSGHEFERICSVIWELNEWEPQQRIDSAKKASRAGTGSTST
jgi:hypothetical protein